MSRSKGWRWHCPRRLLRASRDRPSDPPGVIPCRDRAQARCHDETTSPRLASISVTVGGMQIGSQTFKVLEDFWLNERTRREGLGNPGGEYERTRRDHNTPCARFAAWGVPATTGLTAARLTV